MSINQTTIKVTPQGSDKATILIDGYTVSATFAGNKNKQAYLQVKQILLSSCANSLSGADKMDITTMM